MLHFPKMQHFEKMPKKVGHILVRCSPHLFTPAPEHPPGWKRRMLVCLNSKRTLEPENKTEVEVQEKLKLVELADLATERRDNIKIKKKNK